MCSDGVSGEVSGEDEAIEGCVVMNDLDVLMDRRC